MTIIEGYGGIVKALTLLVFLAGIILTFQNCGETARNTGILQQTEAYLEPASCPTGSCLTSADYLWLNIREYNPYQIEISTLNTGHFNVSGLCGVGDFANHSFVWELVEGFGSQRVVGQGFSDNRCVNGRFVVPIVPNGTVVIQPDQRYTLFIELVGITDSNEEVSNPMPNNQGTLDILFTTTPPN